MAKLGTKDALEEKANGGEEEEIEEEREKGAAEASVDTGRPSTIFS